MGQNYELQVEIPAGLVDQADLDRMKEDFFRAHEMNYGYYNPNAPVQFVNFRSEAIGQVQKPRLAELTGHMETPSGAVIDHRDVYFEESGLVRCLSTTEANSAAVPVWTARALWSRWTPPQSFRPTPGLRWISTAI